MQHFRAHKDACTAVKRAVDAAAHAKEDLLAVEGVDIFRVGRFWGMYETRPYMLSLASQIEALERMGTDASLRVAIDVLFECLRLNRRDNMGLRDIAPGIFLRLNEDQHAYDFLRWWAQDRPTYDWENAALPYLDIRGADATESPESANFIGPFGGPSLLHLVALVLVKLRVRDSIEARGCFRVFLAGTMRERSPLSLLGGQTPALRLIQAFSAPPPSAVPLGALQRQDNSDKAIATNEAMVAQLDVQLTNSIVQVIELSVTCKTVRPMNRAQERWHRLRCLVRCISQFALLGANQSSAGELPPFEPQSWHRHKLERFQQAYEKEYVVSQEHRTDVDLKLLMEIVQSVHAFSHASYTSKLCTDGLPDIRDLTGMPLDFCRHMHVASLHDGQVVYHQGDAVDGAAGGYLILQGVVSTYKNSAYESDVPYPVWHQATFPNDDVHFGTCVHTATTGDVFGETAAIVLYHADVVQVLAQHDRVDPPRKPGDELAHLMTLLAVPPLARSPGTWHSTNTTCVNHRRLAAAVRDVAKALRQCDASLFFRQLGHYAVDVIAQEAMIRVIDAGTIVLQQDQSYVRTTRPAAHDTSSLDATAFHPAEILPGTVSAALLCIPGRLVAPLVQKVDDSLLYNPRQVLDQATKPKSDTHNTFKLANFLSTTATFAALPHRTLVRVLESMQVVDVPFNHLLWDQGERLGNGVVVVLSGTVLVVQSGRTQSDPSGRLVLHVGRTANTVTLMNSHDQVRTYGPGDCIGSMRLDDTDNGTSIKQDTAMTLSDCKVAIVQLSASNSKDDLDPMKAIQALSKEKPRTPRAREHWKLVIHYIVKNRSQRSHWPCVIEFARQKRIRLVMDIVKHVPVFQAMDVALRMRICERTLFQTLAPNYVGSYNSPCLDRISTAHHTTSRAVHDKGKPVERFFVVVSGSVDLIHVTSSGPMEPSALASITDTNDSALVKIRTVHEGEWFGEYEIVAQLQHRQILAVTTSEGAHVVGVYKGEFLMSWPTLAKMNDRLAFLRQHGLIRDGAVCQSDALGALEDDRLCSIWYGIRKLRFRCNDGTHFTGIYTVVVPTRSSGAKVVDAIYLIEEGECVVQSQATLVRAVKEARYQATSPAMALDSQTALVVTNRSHEKDVQLDVQVARLTRGNILYCEDTTWKPRTSVIASSQLVQALVLTYPSHSSTV
ncbi:hypothetical protein DYB32_001573 [Aphanomyces invadans]|uniref:Cyclic nucleotide-binding domain-containing protein n=1 Tax=Aphanomyces invadans TaxID=157072 RepID=A0A3R7ADY6_9STRA|nr:hypothetical protein DYB32_001573 [Aphanomyces invadans]